jgi:hypothetical protein
VSLKINPSISTYKEKKSMANFDCNVHGMESDAWNGDGEIR